MIYLIMSSELSLSFRSGYHAHVQNVPRDGTDQPLIGGEGERGGADATISVLLLWFLINAYTAF
jgi:hypothetical protein